MKKHISTKNKIATLAALVTLVASQSGFIAGLATIFTPAGLPLIVTGLTLQVVGGAMVPCPDEDVEITGWALFWTGFVLDQQNPSHVDALNEVPNTKMQQAVMGVTGQDIQAYNDRLAGTEIQDAYNKFKSETAAELSAWATQNGKSLKDIAVQGPKLISSEQLNKAAAHLNLSQSDAKILLFKAFGTRSID